MGKRHVGAAYVQDVHTVPQFHGEADVFKRRFRWMVKLVYLYQSGLLISAFLVRMCRVELYLSDASATMCVTLFANEAEKLIGYTATQLKTSDEKNISFVKEIEAAVHKKPVTCFIKGYKKTFCGNNVRAHTVLKMYLQRDVSNDADKADDSMVICDCEGSPTKNKLGVQDSAGNHPFSTQKILKEISDMSSHDESGSSVSSKVKRPLFSHQEYQLPTESLVKAAVENVSSQLNFDTVEKPLEGASEVNPCTTKAEGKKIVAGSAVESPIKKSKNKEKEC